MGVPATAARALEKAVWSARRSNTRQGAPGVTGERVECREWRGGGGGGGREWGPGEQPDGREAAGVGNHGLPQESV